MTSFGYRLTEIGLICYLLLISGGARLPPVVREIPLFVVLLGLLLARLPLARSQPPKFSLLVPLLLFIASTAVSTVFSTYPQLSFHRAIYAPIAFVLFLAVQDVATTASGRKKILMAITLVMLALGVDGIYQYLTGSSALGVTPFRGRITAGLPHPNDLALISIVLPLSLPVIRSEPKKWLKASLLSGLALTLITIVLSQSRNAWLGLAVGLFVTMSLDKASRRTGALIATLATLVFLVAYVTRLADFPGRVAKVLDLPSEPRIGHWLVAWKMFRESPLIGKGIHTFGEFYLPYLETVTLPRHVQPEIAYIPWAHNLYLEMLAERGILGAAAFLAPLLGLAPILRKALRSGSPPEAANLAASVSGAFASFLTQALFDITFLKDWVLLLFWLLVGFGTRLSLIESGANAAESLQQDDDRGDAERRKGDRGPN